MIDALGYAPIAATAFAIPEFLPQLLKLRATRDTAGISWSWATLADPRLIALGLSGVTASVLMLARIHRTARRYQPVTPEPVR
jgi:hypothetical protein